MSTSEDGSSTLFSDRPIDISRSDRIGFLPFAQRLAQIAGSRNNSEGTVIGIEGAWGSGKSTIMASVHAQLASRSVSRSQARLVTSDYILVTFEPWLIGSKEGLLAAFFSELLLTLEKAANRDSFLGLGGDEQLPRLLSLLRSYVAAISQLGPPAEAAAKLAGHPIVGAVTKAVFGALGPLLKTSISDTRIEIAEALRRQHRRIIVFIDDLDRLDPSETAEVLRLIRSVAAFPQVTYIVAYDPEVVANALTEALNLDGRRFLEKIVQVRFLVPSPEDFDLRIWLRESLIKANEGGTTIDASDTNNRLAFLIMGRPGQLLTTPRDVVRSLNAYNALDFAPAGFLDNADRLWIALVATTLPHLMKWFRAFISARNQFDLGASITDEEAHRYKTTLGESFTSSGLRPDEGYEILTYVLPWFNAFNFSINGEDKRADQLFKKVEASEFGPLEAAHRLAHPRFSRMYFASTSSRGALPVDFEDRLADATRDGAAFSAWILEEASRTRPQGGPMSDYILQQIFERADSLDSAQLEAIAQGLADSMDAAVIGKDVGDWGRHWIWVTADRLFERFIIDSDPAGDAVCALASSCRSLGWMANWHRGQLHRPSSGSSVQRVLSEEALNKLTQVLTERFRKADFGLVRVPQFLGLLFDWKASGDLLGARKWLAEHMVTDENLVAVASALRGWMSINGVVFKPLRRQDLEEYLDYPQLISRMEAVAVSTGPLASEAKILLAASRVDED